MSFLVRLRFLGNYFLHKLYLFALSYNKSWMLCDNSTIYSVQPPDDILREAKHAGRFFKYVGNTYPGSESRNGSGSAYRLLTEEEIELVSFNDFLEVITSFRTIPSALLFIPSLCLQHRGTPRSQRWGDGISLVEVLKNSYRHTLGRIRMRKSCQVCAPLCFWTELCGLHVLL